jgi:cytosine permease
MSNQLPSYLKEASPNSMDNRAPWYKNTAPSYAGIFLSVPFMAGMAGALAYGSVNAAIIGLILGSLFCFLIYYVPGILGFTTGMPLYVVGSSTFGTKGGILMPGLLMGVLQIGWHAVFTYTAASFFMKAIGSDAQAGSLLFWIVAAGWGLVMAFVGATGIGLLGAISSWVPLAPLIVIIIAGFSNLDGISKFSDVMSEFNSFGSAVPVMGIAAFAAFQSAAGFFATAGAAGADFTSNSRSEKDVVMGGLVGITITALVAGIFAIMTMAGAIGNNPELAEHAGTGTFAAFIESIGTISGLAKIMYWVFLIACICPTGFCAFLAANAFSTMFPKIPSKPMTLVSGGVGVILAATGVAADLVGFFGIIGASFGPILGAMFADYIRSRGWNGPREGVNWAGYIAWACGFIVGILGVIPGIGFAYGLETLMSFIVGFAVYLLAAGMGCEPKSVPLEK